MEAILWEGLRVVFELLVVVICLAVLSVDFLEYNDDDQNNLP